MLSSLKQKGVSLIEILITTLILGVGLLGVAALQVSSLTGNQEGFFTSQATSIAEDLASRIRSAKFVTMTANAPLLHADYIANYVNADDDPLACDAAAAKACFGSADTAQCTIAEIAAYDNWDVCTNAKNTLPNGKVYVVNKPVGSRRLTIVVDWDSISERKDVGNVKNINAQCNKDGAGITGSDVRNCVIVEILP